MKKQLFWFGVWFWRGEITKVAGTHWTVRLPTAMLLSLSYVHTDDSYGETYAHLYFK